MGLLSRGEDSRNLWVYRVGGGGGGAAAATGHMPACTEREMIWPRSAWLPVARIYGAQMLPLPIPAPDLTPGARPHFSSSSFHIYKLNSQLQLCRICIFQTLLSGAGDAESQEESQQVFHFFNVQIQDGNETAGGVVMKGIPKLGI